MDKINILYCFDNGFWKMAAVSIKSLVSTQNHPKKLVIHCMVAKHTKGKKLIQKIIHEAGATLIWRPVSNRKSPFRKHTYERWSPVIFYRLFSYNEFPNTEKMLYLDSDTLVLTDLTDLYNTDVSEYVLAGVRDMAPPEKPEIPGSIDVSTFKKQFLKHNIYINSGVLLLNQKKLREHLPQLLNTNVPLRFPDQDIINAALDGKILLLPLRYNFVPGIYISKKFDKTDAENAKSNPAIYHFYSIKPFFFGITPPKIYSLFYRTCSPLGFFPEDFAKLYVKQREKHLPKKKNTQATNIPYLYLNKRGQLKLFRIFRV